MSFAAIVAWSVRHRVLVFALSFVLLAGGAWQALLLPIDVLPDLTRPTVTVHAESPRLSAADVETQVAWPIENALMGLPDVRHVRSTSVAGLGLVIAEFDWGTDPYRNRQLAAERLDSVRAQLPADVQPRIAPLASLMGEILLVGLNGAEDEASMRALRSHADWILRPALLGVNGVAQVTVLGGEVAQWEIRPDFARLRLFRTGLPELESAVRDYGSNLGGGITEGDGHEQTIRGLATPFSPSDLLDVPVSWRDGRPVWLRQVATVEQSARVRRGSAGVDGHDAVLLAIQKQPGADTLAVTRAVERQLAALDASLPAQAHRSIVFRQADFIATSVGNVREALGLAVLIVALVLGAFLTGARATLISLAAIPLSMAGALLVLHGFGLTINTLTLGGLAIAIGELVDDAVVGVENVARRMREGVATASTVIDATVEVRSGILLATLLIAGGFAPLFALGGIEGRLFTSLGAAYVAAILASLVVAATVTPALCSVFLRPDVLPHERPWLVRIKSRYAGRLRRVVERPRALFISCGLLLVGTVIAALLLPRAFLPPFNERTLTVNLVLPPGIALTESERAGRAAERICLSMPGVAHVGRRTGRAELDEHAEGVHYSELDVQLKDDAPARNEVAAELRERLSVLPGSVTISAPITHRLDHLLSGVRAPLAIKVFGDDPVELGRLVDTIRAQLASIPGLSEAGLEAQGHITETRIQVDAARAAQFGVSPSKVLDTATALSAGRTVSRLVDGPRRLELVVRAGPDARAPAQLADLPIDTPSGAVPLSWLADVGPTAVPDRVIREDGRRRMVISIFPKEGGGDFDRAAAAAEKKLSALELPHGYEIRFDGERAAQRSATATIGLIALCALAVMAALLQARYGSWRLALAVLASVPLACVGGVLALAVTGTPMSVASLVGFVTLAGIAARNAILKISRYRQLAAEEGMPFGTDLVVRGASERFTPVAMTALVAAASLAPLLLSAHAPGKEVLHPVALVVFGGLLGSTLLDAFVTPAIAAWLGPAAFDTARNIDIRKGVSPTSAGY